MAFLIPIYLFPSRLYTSQICWDRWAFIFVHNIPHNIPTELFTLCFVTLQAELLSVCCSDWLFFLPVEASAWKANRMEHKSGPLSSSRESAFTSPISVTKPVVLAGGVVLSSPKEVSEDKGKQPFFVKLLFPIYLNWDKWCGMYSSNFISFVAILSSVISLLVIPISIQR